MRESAATAIDCACRVIHRGLLCALVLLVAGTGGAVTRVQQRFDARNGLTVPAVFSLAQDANGFIWIGTAGGLVRYDGSQMRPWAKELVKRDIPSIATSSSGDVIFAETAGTLYSVTANGVVPVNGPSGQPFTDVFRTAFDGAGRLWVVTGNREIYFRNAEQTWISLNAPATFPGERPYRVKAGSSNSVYILTNRSVWRMRGSEQPTKLLAIIGAMDLVEHPDGSVFVLAWSKGAQGGEIIEWRDGHTATRFATPNRPIELAIRGRTVWAATSHTLISLTDGKAEVIGAENDLPSGGPLLVDHEGSLWLGTFAGLIQYPEPDTIIWNQKDGLPSAHTRRLVQTDEGVWVMLWNSLALISQDDSGWVVHREATPSSLACKNTDGNLVFSSDAVMVMRREGRFMKYPPMPIGISAYMCSPASDGGAWVATGRGLVRFHKDGHSELVRPQIEEAGVPANVHYVFEDSHGTLWAAYEGSICQSSAAALLNNQNASWSCQHIGEAANGFDSVELPSGNLWMSTNRAGVWRRRDQKWERIPGSQSLGSDVMFGLTSSPAGGVWVLGHGTAVRVIERVDLPDGWQVVEVLSPWHGLPSSSASHLIEDSDGSLWLATASGVVRVPGAARRADARPPRVQLVDVMINGQRADLGSDLSALPHGSQIELQFAALSFRDRGRLRYQYRLNPEEPWIDVRDTAPVLRFVDVGAGKFQAEVRASLDGQEWSIVPARLSFAVLKPWYLRAWALFLFAVLVVAILYAIYRARIAVLMRLERQRAQIARDLHDEMGSGLGSIGILSGLAAENNMNAVEHQELARKIAQTAGELGTTLTEIVWALKLGATTLEGLAYHLAERGGRLFPGNEATFKTQFPVVWPRIELSVAVRRNVLMIVTEAMHNAARHAKAGEVVLGLEATAGRCWRLWLNDDGCGIASSNGANGSGLGLDSMQRRAEEIGAVLALLPNNGRGTSLSLVFDPRAEDARLL